MRGLPTAERGDVVATCRRKECCRKIAQAQQAGKAPAMTGGIRAQSRQYTLPTAGITKQKHPARLRTLCDLSNQAPHNMAVQSNVPERNGPVARARHARHTRT